MISLYFVAFLFGFLCGAAAYTLWYHLVDSGAFDEGRDD